MAERPAQKQPGSALARCLRGITHLVAQRPRVTLWLVLVLSCACVGVTVSFIRFNTDRAELVDSDAAGQERWRDYKEHFGDGSDMIVVVEAGDPATVREIQDKLGERLEREPEIFTHVLYKVDARDMHAKGLQFLTTSELQAARDRVRNFSPILRQNRWDLVELQSYAALLDRQIKSRVQEGRDPTPVVRQAHRLTASINRFFWHTRNGFQLDETTFRPPWPATGIDEQYAGAAANDVVYMMNEDRTKGFIKVFAVENKTDFIRADTSIARLREHIADLHTEYEEDQSVQVSLTGVPVLEHDEMHRAQTDMLKACGISFVAVGLLLLAGFRGVRHPMLALLLLVVGTSWAFGYTTLLIGHVNILSVSFAVILIGLGIDFAIHYLSRYLQLRHEGHGLIDALVESSGSVGTGIVTAAVTTALAFLCATLTDFVGVAELGIIAGGGILLCALATFIVLPALIRLADADVPAEKLARPVAGNGLRAVISGWPVLVILLSVAIIGGVSSQAFRLRDGKPEPRIRYDANLLNLQAADLESVEVQNRVFDSSSDSLLFAVSMADSWEETLQLKTQFEALPSVARVEELASHLPPEPTLQEQQLITALRSDLSGLPRRVPAAFRSADPSQVGQALEGLYLTVARTPGSASESTARGLDRFLDEFMELPLNHQVGFLNAYQSLMAASLLGQFRSMATATDLEPVRYADLPSSLTRRFMASSEQGQQKWLLQIYPKKSVWDEEPLAEFVHELRSVDPEVTGTPLQNFEAARQIRNSYETAAMYALGIISLVLMLDFLRPGQKLLTLIPPIAIVGFVGYTLHQRNGELNPHLLVVIYLVMVGFIGAVLDFRNLRDMFLALLPPLAGGAMMLGALVLLGVHFNPANLIVLPLVLGIGVDDGVHVVHDYRRQMRQGNEYEISASTLNGILLTSLTSMVGFGSLMVSSHQGLFSVGLVLLVGVGCCLFVSLIPLPAILTLVGSSAEAAVSHPVSAGSVSSQTPEAEGSSRPQKKRARAA